MADISIQKVTKSYGRTQVVHGVDLEISHGEFIVILGPSGCGKSTLLRMIAGLEAINSGEIAIAGRVVNELEPRSLLVVNLDYLGINRIAIGVDPNQLNALAFSPHGDSCLAH